MAGDHRVRRGRAPLGLPAVMLALALSPGCTKPPHCESYEPYPELLNHVQPFEIAVDPVRRRALSTSLASRTVGVYDLDWSGMVKTVPVGPRPLVYPDVAVDEAGVAWITNFSQPPVIRLVPDGGERSFPDGAISLARRVVAAGGGGAVVLGVDRDGVSLLERHGPGGGVEASAFLDRDGLGLVDLGGDRVGVLIAGDELGELEIRTQADLAVVESCDLPFPAGRGALLSDGTVLVTSRTRVGRAGCGGEAPADWESGVENQDVIALDDGTALVLDRIGPDDPNLGVARRWDRDGPLDPDGFPTAKNTGYGAYDPVLGRVWANSEGTSEVIWAFPDEGAVVGSLRTGTHLDGLALDPEHEGGVVLTGRLSDTVQRLSVFETVARTDGVRWPFSPVVDPARDRVWVLSQTDAAVHGLARGTLDGVSVLPTGDPPNGLLTFGSLALHPGRDTLLVAESAADALIELDPADGSERGRWPLGGPAIDDPDVIGHLSVHPQPDGDAALLCRTTDGRVQRIDLATGELQTTWLEAQAVASLGEGNAVHSATLLADAGLFYAGGFALDAATLDRRADADLDVLRVVGTDPTDPDGALIVVDAGGRRLQRLAAGVWGVAGGGGGVHRGAADGTVVGEFTLADLEVRASLFRIDPLRERVLVLRSADARLCSFPLREIR